MLQPEGLLLIKGRAAGTVALVNVGNMLHQLRQGRLLQEQKAPLSIAPMFVL
jgi:hypothetical protein